MKSKTLCILALILISAIAAAQERSPVSTSALQAPEAEERLRLAASSSAYPVTPGDAYRLTFQQGETVSTLEVLVATDYTIQLNVFGKMNAAGMTFAQAKQTIEKAFVAAYPRSMPYLSISSIGVFQVFLTGQTLEAQNVTAWGMSRLSDILEGRTGPYSSLRNIQVISLSGKKQSYDLFKFRRMGQVDQNPYVRAGDTIVVSTSERTVEISGEVKHPGKYQLLPADQLKEMVESFGGGLTSAAETSAIRIDRVSGQKARTLYISLNNGSGGNTRLEDGDMVIVPSKTSRLPVAFFEGAVAQEQAAGGASTAASETTGLLPPVSYNRVSYPFREGETLRSALVSVRHLVQPSANLTAAFVIRAGGSTTVPVDLAALLSGTDSTSDFELRPLDRIVIPSGDFSVVVSGDVTRPGSYPYSPSQYYRYYADLAGFADVEEVPQNILVLDSHGTRRSLADAIEPGSRIYLTASRVAVQGAVFNPGSFSYRKDFNVWSYENLAGGFDPEKSSGGDATIFDAKGKERKPTDSILPGDRIYVHVDKFIYNFNKDLPVFLSVVGVATSIITIYALLR